MTIIFPTTQDGQVVELGDGIHVGQIWGRNDYVEYVGNGVDRTTYRVDGTFNYGFLDGVFINRVTFRDLTVDANNLSTQAAMFASTAGGGPVRIVLERVRIINTHRNTIAVINARELDASSLTVIGDGGGIQADVSSTYTRLRDVDVRGSRFGFVVSDGASVGSVRGVDVERMRVRHHYWASPTYEAVTATAYASNYVDVTSHVVDHRRRYDCLRSLTPRGTYRVGSVPVPLTCQQWDRVEVGDGRWTQVLNVVGGQPVLDSWHANTSWALATEPVGELATVYEVKLGRLLDWTSTRLKLTHPSIPPSTAQWRRVVGGFSGTPTGGAGSRLDVIRHGYYDAGAVVPSPPRDVDTGAYHFTSSTGLYVVRDSLAEGGFSDGFSLDGVDGEAHRCLSTLGQDMAWTLRGTHGSPRLFGCTADRTGVHGFFATGGPAHLSRCVATYNGASELGYGVAFDDEEDAWRSLVDVSGYGNRSGLYRERLLRVGSKLRRR